MRKSKFLVCLFACVQLLAQPVLACPSFPESISLQGSTFSDLNLSIRKNGGFSLSITRASDSELTAQVRERLSTAMSAWNASHSQPDYSDSAAYDRHRLERDAFEAAEAERLRTQLGIQSEAFMTRDGAICRRAGAACVATGSRVFTNAAGKIIGRLEACNGGFCLFSVKKNGEKDINLPYLKFASLQSEGSRYGSARIEAYDRSRQIGQMEVFGSPATRGAFGARGSLELRGNAISSSGSGCGGGGVSVVPFGSSGGAATGPATSGSN